MKSFSARRVPPCALVWLCLAAEAMAQTPSTAVYLRLLPPKAKIIETANVNVGGGKTRTLVLWMLNPRRIMAHWDSCSEFLYGDHWYGPTNLSLVDPSSGKLINTISIHAPSDGADEGFAVPFFTSDVPYYVPHPNKDHKGAPILLNLRDLTGEGTAGQFALFDYGACGISTGSVFGYSPKTDRAVQFGVEVTNDRFPPEAGFWIDNVFEQRPARPGAWDFDWEPGHGSEERIHEDVRFDPARQLFVEHATTRPYSGYSRALCEIDANDLPELFAVVERSSPGFEGKKMADFIASLPGSSGTSAVITVQGERTTLDLDWSTNKAGRMVMQLQSKSAPLAALLPGLAHWCSAE